MVKTLYLLLLSAAAFFYLFYEDRLSLITLLALAILPVLLLLQLIISAAALKCSAVKKSAVIIKDESAEVCFALINNSFFPLSGCKVRVRAVFEPWGTVRHYTVEVPLSARSTQTVSLNLDALHCCKVDLRLEYVKIYDLLHLFSAKCLRRRGISASAYILPRISDELCESARAALDLPICLSDADGRPDRRAGGSADIADFRSFSPGDRLSMIHYKLSARFDTDIVKVFSDAERRRYLLSADLSAGSRREDIELRDDILQRLLSCAYYLFEQNAEVYTELPPDCGYTVTSIGGVYAAKAESSADILSFARILCGSGSCGAADIGGAAARCGFIPIRFDKSEDCRYAEAFFEAKRR